MPWRKVKVERCLAKAAKTSNDETNLKKIQLSLARLLVAGFCVFSLVGMAAGGPVSPGVLETKFLRFSFGDHCEILDKEAQVVWGGASTAAAWGEVRLKVDGQTQNVPLQAAAVKTGARLLVASFHPVATRPAATLRVSVRPLADDRTLEFSYEADSDLSVESISLLPETLAVTDAGRGFVVVPAREGLLVPADSKLNFSHSFDTYGYEGCQMEMLGLAQQGAALLLTWTNPYVAARVHSVTRRDGEAPHQSVTASLELRKSAHSFCVHVLGKGDEVTIAKAYRNVALERGWLVGWDKKLKGHPERAKLFGAANIKLWSALEREMNEDSTKEERVRVHWTFEEAAEVAEHLKNDLKLERVLFTIGGWTHRGYDNQHPDILPTAPECGGDIAFSNCARRVENLGYLFCLHDNYQDIYHDSPSWNERLIMKTWDGKLAKGGHWAGGTAYLTCSEMALELAKRPQNLAAVRSLCAANSYFIDTTYAAGLQECFDPAHPLTRSDDMHWKQALSDYARETFGVFGSEDGQEWALPHCDFFEGITGVSGRCFHNEKLLSELGAVAVPLFDLVYRECAAMYGKYGYDPRQAADYVLRHISLARPLNYHEMPEHLYWRRQGAWEERRGADQSPGAADPALFTHGENGWTAGMHPMDRFIKNTYEILSPLNELTARSQMTRHEFLTDDRQVERTVFGEGANATQVIVNHGTEDYVCQSSLGGKVVLPRYGFLVESPTFVAFHAKSWGGIDYGSPSIFTLRSLDNRRLSRSHRIRVYHANGNAEIRLGGVTRTVPREAEIE